jgi:hypothetical protein
MAVLAVSRQQGLRRAGAGYSTALMSPGPACGRASSFTSLRETTHAFAQPTFVAYKRRAQICSSREAVGVKRSEVKEEAGAQRQPGDTSGGLHPPPLVNGPFAEKLARKPLRAKE